MHTPTKSEAASKAAGTPYYTPSMTVATEQHTPGLKYMRQELERLSGSEFSEDSMSPSRFQKKATLEQKLLTKRQRNASSARAAGRNARKNIGLAIEQGLCEKFPRSKSPALSEKSLSPQKSPSGKGSPSLKTPSPKVSTSHDRVLGTPDKMSITVPLQLTPGRHGIAPAPRSPSSKASPGKAAEAGLFVNTWKEAFSFKSCGSWRPRESHPLDYPQKGITLSPLKSGTPSPNRLVIFSPGKFSQPSSAEKAPAKVLRERGSTQSPLKRSLEEDACFKEPSQAKKKRKRAHLVPVPRSSPLRNAFQSNWEARHDAHNYDQIRGHVATAVTAVQKEAKGTEIEGAVSGRARNKQSGTSVAPSASSSKSAQRLPRAQSFPPQRKKKGDSGLSCPLDVNMELVPQLGKMACSSSNNSEVDGAKKEGAKTDQDLPSVLGLVRKDSGEEGPHEAASDPGGNQRGRGKRPERGKRRKKSKSSVDEERGAIATCPMVDSCLLSDCAVESFDVFMSCDRLSGKFRPDPDFILPPP